MRRCSASGLMVDADRVMGSHPSAGREILPVRESGRMDLADRMTGLLVGGLTAVQTGLVRGLVSGTPQNEPPAEHPAEHPAEDHQPRAARRTVQLRCCGLPPGSPLLVRTPQQRGPGEMLHGGLV